MTSPRSSTYRAASTQARTKRALSPAYRPAKCSQICSQAIGRRRSKAHVGKPVRMLDLVDRDDPDAAGQAPALLLIRGFGVRVPGGVLAQTPSDLGVLAVARALGSFWWAVVGAWWERRAQDRPMCGRGGTSRHLRSGCGRPWWWPGCGVTANAVWPSRGAHRGLCTWAGPRWSWGESGRVRAPHVGSVRCGWRTCRPSPHELRAEVDGPDTGALGVMSEGELPAFAPALRPPRVAQVGWACCGRSSWAAQVRGIDPATIDGPVRVRGGLAAFREVTVFSYHDRLPRVIRGMAVRRVSSSSLVVWARPWRSPACSTHPVRRCRPRISRGL
jgi:hypothetical protein